MGWKVLKLSSEGISKTFLMFFKQMHLTRFISSYCAIINESNVHGEQEGENNCFHAIGQGSSTLLTMLLNRAEHLNVI